MRKGPKNDRGKTSYGGLQLFEGGTKWVVKLEGEGMVERRREVVSGF